MSGAALLANGDARISLSVALAGYVYDAAALPAKHANRAAYARLAAVVALDAVLLGVGAAQTRRRDESRQSGYKRV
ncbi:MAG: hypothetical protein K2P58_11425 [Hyphomonadaceae bacterium]|nr:hypothetical protein [Hyphomonadaceae bacterium]